MAESKRRSWIFAIGAPYVLMLAAGLVALVKSSLPLWVSQALILTIVGLGFVYLVVGLAWIVRNARGDIREAKRLKG